MRVAVISFSDLENDPRVRRQVETFLAEGWEIHALASGGSWRHPNLHLTISDIQRRRAGVLRYLVEYAGFMVRAFFWIARLVVNRAVDVVYVNSPPDILTLACLPARLRGLPVILDVHDPMPELWTAKERGSSAVSRILEIQERLGIRLADSVLTVHEPMRRLLERRNPERDIEVVMNVPDTEDLVALPHNPASRLVVFAGNVAFRYGLDDIVRAIAGVGDKIPELRLRVIGDGEDLVRLRHLAERLDVPLELTGRVPWGQVRSLQEGAWVGVNVPKPDALGELSFSNKIAEWVAMELPVLASRTTTLLTYFPEGSLEYVVGGAPDSIAQGLEHLHRMTEIERRVRVDAARRALDSIAWPIQRDKLLEVVRSAAHSG